MKKFFEEYGKIIVTTVVAISLIAVTVALRPVVQNNLDGLVGDMSNSMGSITISEVNVGGGAGGSGTGGNSNFVDAGTSNIINNYVDGTNVSGDFSTKGNLVTISGKSFRVLGVNGTQAKVMSMVSYSKLYYSSIGVTTDFNGTSGQKYADSTLDSAMDAYYNSLPTAIQNAIVEQNIIQSMYSWTKGTDASAGFSSWHKNSFTETDTSGTNYYLTRKTDINAGNRKVYALDIDDVIAYLGSTSTPQDVNEMFYGQRSATSGKYVWLRSANLDNENSAFYVDSNGGGINTSGNVYLVNCEARPAFVIDLSLLS